jgi:hypothetical protein
MNVGKEGMLNCENLGARIMGNRALDQKIWGLEAFRGKTLFLGGSGPILEFLECLESLGAKDRAHANFGKFSGISVEFWRA